MNGASSNLAITAGSIGAAVSQGVSRTPASMSRSIQTYVPFFTPDGETMSERPAHGSFANSGKNGSRVRSHVALTPPNPNTVVDPWWSDTTSPLAWSLAQYAGSNAAGIVPSRQPASVEGGGMPATALAMRRAPPIPRASVRFPPRRHARSNRRKNPIPAKIAIGIIRYSVCRYGIRTRGAAAMPTAAEPRRATSQPFTWSPSGRKSLNGRPHAANDRRRTSGTKYRRPIAGTRNVVPGTPMTTETTPITRIVPAAAAYAAAGRRSAGYRGRYRQARRALARTIPARRTRPAGHRASNAHHGWTLTSGKIDSRKVVAYPSQYTNVPAMRTLANATSRFA